MDLEQIEQAVSELPPEDLAAFSTWFDEYIAEKWDRQIEEDAEAGRLDDVIEKAKDDHEAGRSRPL